LQEPDAWLLFWSSWNFCWNTKFDKRNHFFLSSRGGFLGRASRAARGDVLTTRSFVSRLICNDHLSKSYKTATQKVDVLSQKTLGVALWFIKFNKLRNREDIKCERTAFSRSTKKHQPCINEQQWDWDQPDHLSHETHPKPQNALGAILYCLWINLQTTRPCSKFDYLIPSRLLFRPTKQLHRANAAATATPQSAHTWYDLWQPTRSMHPGQPRGARADLLYRKYLCWHNLEPIRACMADLSRMRSFQRKESLRTPRWARSWWGRRSGLWNCTWSWRSRQRAERRGRPTAESHRGTWSLSPARDTKQCYPCSVCSIADRITTVTGASGAARDYCRCSTRPKAPDLIANHRMRI
jgi:hypothetical protein